MDGVDEILDPPLIVNRSSISASPSLVHIIVSASLTQTNRHHYPACPSIPAAVRREVERVRHGKKSQKSKGSAGNYWIESCTNHLHMVDGHDGRSGIFFEGTEHAGMVDNAKKTKASRARGRPKKGTSTSASTSTNEGADGSSSTGKKKGSSSTGGQIKRAIQSRFSRKGSSSSSSTGEVGGAAPTAIPLSRPTLAALPPSRRHSTGGVMNVNVNPPQHLFLSHQHAHNPSYDPAAVEMVGSAMPTMEPAASSMPPIPMPMNHMNPMPMNSMPLPTPTISMMPTVPGGIPYGNNSGGMARQDPVAAAPTFQAGMTGHVTGGGEHRRASLPTTADGGSSSFSLDLFEPRPLREDGRGFVDEQAADPAASAYYGSAPLPPTPPPAGGTGGSTGRADYTTPTKNDPSFQTEYGFMGINDVVKGHEEKAGAYRDRRSSCASRGSGSTFPNSGSKRGLTSDDGDSIGTNEFEPPRRRPSYNSSIASDDLDDLRALDLEQDYDDFDTEFATGAPSKGGGVASPVTHHASQPPAVFSYPAGTMPAAHSAGIDTTFAGAVADGATANTTSNDVEAQFIGGRVERNDSNVSDSSSLGKALQHLEEVFTADFPEAGGGGPPNEGPLAG